MNEEEVGAALFSKNCEGRTCHFVFSFTSQWIRIWLASVKMNSTEGTYTFYLEFECRSYDVEMRCLKCSVMIH